MKQSVILKMLDTVCLHNLLDMFSLVCEHLLKTFHLLVRGGQKRHDSLLGRKIKKAESIQRGSRHDEAQEEKELLSDKEEVIMFSGL